MVRPAYSHSNSLDATRNKKKGELMLWTVHGEDTKKEESVWHFWRWGLRKTLESSDKPDRH